MAAVSAAAPLGTAGDGTPAIPVEKLQVAPTAEGRSLLHPTSECGQGACTCSSSSSNSSDGGGSTKAGGGDGSNGGGGGSNGGGSNDGSNGGSGSNGGGSNGGGSDVGLDEAALLRLFADEPEAPAIGRRSTYRIEAVVYDLKRQRP